MTASLERMLEPDPDLRPTGLAAVLDGMRAQAGVVPPPGATFEHGRSMPSDAGDPSEDAVVKSVRKLLWLLWGLGWVIVPLVAGRLFGAQELVPVVMFVSLAVLLVVTWHKGAVIRAALRARAGRQGLALARPANPSAPRARVEVSDARRVRVHTSELRDDELIGRTELQTAGSDRPPPPVRTS